MTPRSFTRTMRLPEVCKALGRSERTVQRYVDTGRLVTRLDVAGRGRLFCADQVEQLAQAWAIRPGSSYAARAREYHKARARAYQAALHALRKKHLQQFREMYETALAAEGVVARWPPGDDHTTPTL